MENAGRSRSTHFEIPGRAQLAPQPPLGSGQPGGHGSFRDTQGYADLPVRIAVIVTEDNGRRLPGRQSLEGIEEVRTIDHCCRVALELRLAEPAKELAHLPKPLVAAVGGGGGGGGCVHAGLRRGLPVPPAPGALWAGAALLWP